MDIIENKTFTSDDFTIVGRDEKESERIYKKSMTFWEDVWLRFKKNKIALFFLGLLIFFILLAIIGPYLNSYTYNEQDLSKKLISPAEGFASGYYFGGDELGRDLFTRVMQGIRVSLFLSIVVVSISVVFGSLYGALSAYIGGKVDFFMTRFVEIVMAVPVLIYIILLIVVMGNSVKTIIIAMCLTRWLSYALLVRGEVLKLKSSEYVMASESFGGGFFWIVKKHLIPNALGVILVRLTTDIPLIIFMEAFLSYIGIGVPLPQASLGNLSNSGFAHKDSSLSYFLIPSIFISLISLSFNIIGDALNDAIDPKLRNK